TLGTDGSRAAALRALLAVGLCAAALTASALAVLDPLRRAGAAAGALLAAAAVLVCPARGRRALGGVAALGACWSVAAWVGPEFRGDAGSYFVYLRSAVFDHDLDFTNDWQGLERDPPPALPNGRPMNTQSVGPALLWLAGAALAPRGALRGRAPRAA